MTPILLYLLKLSISLSVVLLFYQFVLRRLTFYNWNRWYLVSYSLLSFFIPFIDISIVLNKNEWGHSSVVQWVPAFDAYANTTAVSPVASPFLSTAGMVQFILLAGMSVMLLRLFIQLLSFRKLMRKATIIPSGGLKIYQVDGPIIPFSFGNSIFINRSLHDELELQEIILHEFVHVKQKHSVDIICAEILCLLNWYNPFAWLIRRAIRQNLEFIADNQVLQNGVDRKQYQYLLLKVIGNNHFSIAPKFNFSSLKKRIAMMNKMKSAGVHAVKFLFILPLVAVLLVAFRNSYQDQSNFQQPSSPLLKPGLKHVVYTDTVPSVRTLNSKGYLIDIKGVNGECVVVVKDKTGKEVETVILNEWKEKSDKYEGQYGEILAPPAPPPHPAHAELIPTMAFPTDPAMPPTPPASPSPHADCLLPTIACSSNSEAPIPCLTHGGVGTIVSQFSKDFEITDKSAVIKLKNGTVEKYDFNKPEEKALFEKKYGKVISVHAVPMTNATLISHGSGQTVLAPMVASFGNGVTIMDDFGYAITGKEDIILTITRNTTREELEKFKLQMKEKGIDLTYDEIEYNEKGKLVVLTGHMKSNDGTSNFVATDFEKLVLAMIKKGSKTYFKVSTKNRDVI